MSADGKIATASKESQWISCESSRQLVQKMRAKYMGIMVGTGTLLADNPTLNARIEGARNPVRIICDSSLRIPLDSNICKTAGKYRTIIACAGIQPEIKEKQDLILKELDEEIEKFSKTIQLGQKEFEKVAFYSKDKTINGKTAFRLYDTFGFPLELTIEMAKEIGYNVDEEGYHKAFLEHQEKSRTAAAGTFKGGLSDTSDNTARLHTATHLLLAALQTLFDPNIIQKGSNITPERLRFDFNFPRKMLPEELKQLEDFVNDAIKKEIDVTCEEMTLDEARASGAKGIFANKYGEKVKVYTIGNISKEICGGPHANNTRELKSFKIIKEESSSSGVRRIKAVIG